MRTSRLYILLLTLLAACGGQQNKPNTEDVQTRKGGYFSDCKKLRAEAFYMDSVLFTQNELDTVSAQKAIIAFTDFANYCQSDSLSAIFLVKTAQVAKAINNIPQAKIALDKCIEDYPNFRDRPAALFLLGQLYDDQNYMNDENEAKRLYQKIIDEYPHSDWAMSAKGALAFVGKSDAEITKIIINQKK
jgi:outer membrane protein assembly factor BamD (BamD/ComL family)